MSLTTEDLQAISDLMDKKLEPINNRLDKMDERLDNIENRLEVIEEDVEIIKGASEEVSEHQLWIISKQSFPIILYLKGNKTMIDAMCSHRQDDIHAAEFSDEFNSKLCIPLTIL